MMTCTYDDAALRAVLKSDFRTLSGDSTSASHINAVIAYLLQTALAVSRDLARDWNASSPGTCLPAEVLAVAFKFLPPRDRISASHVSHHWRQSALAFPEVWNRIDIPPGCRKSAALAEMALSRSGQVPVVISHRVAVDPKGALALVNLLPAVQRSGLPDIELDIQNLRTAMILPICMVFIANVVDLDVTLRRGNDAGFALAISTSGALVRRLSFSGIPPRPTGRREDPLDVLGLVLRKASLHGLRTLSAEGTILSALPNHLPAGLSRLTIHLRELERYDDHGSRSDGISLGVDALVRSIVTWDSLDPLPRLVKRIRAPVHVHLQIHGPDLRMEHAQRLLDKIASLGLGRLPPLRVRGFGADVVRAVAARYAGARVVFESGP